MPEKKFTPDEIYDDPKDEWISRAGATDHQLSTEQVVQISPETRDQFNQKAGGRLSLIELIRAKRNNSREVTPVSPLVTHLENQHPPSIVGPEEDFSHYYETLTPVDLNPKIESALTNVIAEVYKNVGISRVELEEKIKNATVTLEGNSCWVSFAEPILIHSEVIVDSLSIKKVYIYKDSIEQQLQDSQQMSPMPLERLVFDPEKPVVLLLRKIDQRSTSGNSDYHQLDSETAKKILDYDISHSPVSEIWPTKMGVLFQEDANTPISPSGSSTPGFDGKHASTYLSNLNEKLHSYPRTQNYEVVLATQVFAQQCPLLNLQETVTPVVPVSVVVNELLKKGEQNIDMRDWQDREKWPDIDSLVDANINKIVAHYSTLRLPITLKVRFVEKVLASQRTVKGIFFETADFQQAGNGSTSRVYRIETSVGRTDCIVKTPFAYPGSDDYKRQVASMNQEYNLMAKVQESSEIVFPHTLLLPKADGYTYLFSSKRSDGKLFLIDMECGLLEDNLPEALGTYMLRKELNTRQMATLIYSILYKMSAFTHLTRHYNSDFKSDNSRMTSEGEVRLTDFNVVKSIEQEMERQKQSQDEVLFQHISVVGRELFEKLIGKNANNFGEKGNSRELATEIEKFVGDQIDFLATDSQDLKRLLIFVCLIQLILFRKSSREQIGSQEEKHQLVEVYLNGDQGKINTYLDQFNFGQVLNKLKET